MAAERIYRVKLVGQLRHDSDRRLEHAYGQLWRWATVPATAPAKESCDATCAALYARGVEQAAGQKRPSRGILDRLLSYARQHDYEIPPELQFIDQAVSGKHWPGQGWIGCGTLRPSAPYRPCCA